MVKITKFIFFSTLIAQRFTHEKSLRLQFTNHFGFVSRKQSITDSNFRLEHRKKSLEDKIQTCPMLFENDLLIFQQAIDNYDNIVYNVIRRTKET